MTEEKSGKITIIAKNIIGKSTNTIHSDAKNIKNYAGNNFTQNSEKGIKYGTNIERKPSNSLKILKIDGPFDDKNKKVEIIEKGKFYKYKIIQFNREPEKLELTNIRWSYKYDNQHNIELFKLRSSKECFIKISENIDISQLTIYSYIKNPNEEGKKETKIAYKKEIFIIITNKVVGYTIQKIFDINEEDRIRKKNIHEFIKNIKDIYELDIFQSNPSTVTSVYDAEIWLFENRKKVKLLHKFHVTRDGWQKIDEKDNKFYIINRAFEPKEENLIYDLKDYKFPQKYKFFKWDAFKIYEENSKESKLQAIPIITNKKLDNKTPINHKREDMNFATDVMIHIGGHYSLINMLGGSLGCFGFVDPSDIRSSPTLVLADAKADKFDDKITDSEWKKLIKIILDYRIKYNSKLKCKIIKRNNYTKSYWLNKEIPYYLWQ